MPSDENKEKETTDGKTVFIESTEPNRPLSRYNTLRLLLNDGKIPVLETWEMDEIAAASTDRYFEVTGEFAHRPDIISLIEYGTEQLYWLIAWVNKMTEPFAQTIVGKRLVIPDRSVVFQALLLKTND
jgi:hypothetical protein